MNIWRQRSLTLKGKVTIVNTVALSQLQYTASVLYVPPNVISSVNDMIFSFLWPKKAHVKKLTVIANITQGGLKMPEFESKVKSCKVMWIKRILSNKKLCSLAEAMGLPMSFVDLCKFKFDVKYMTELTVPFYKQVLQYWYELYSVEPENATKIRSEYLLLNRFICVDE